MNRGSLVLIAYGVFLIAGALTAISISGWDRSKTALFSSGGAAMLVWTSAFLLSRSSELAQQLGRIGGFVFPLLFAATFFWRLTINWGKPLEEAWVQANPGVPLETGAIQSPLQNWLFPVFIVGSLLTFVLFAAFQRKNASASVAQQLS